MKTLLLSSIKAYRLLLSPLLGPRCRFSPTCSLYAQQAIGRHGVIKGLALSVGRLLRCHPVHPGGEDPP